MVALMSECIHGLESEHCATCKGLPDCHDFQEKDLKPAAIKAAVEDLRTAGNFTTIQVSQHPAVVAAHPRHFNCNSFAPLVGKHLSQSWGNLRIEQWSAKGVSPAVWRSTADDAVDGEAGQ